MLTGYCCAHGQTLVYALGCVEQKPIRFSISLQPNQITASDKVPSEIALTVHRLRQREGQLLPAADLRREVEIECLSFRLQLGVILFAELHTVHIMDGHSPKH